jgi:signal transduction histidine kinase
LKRFHSMLLIALIVVCSRMVSAQTPYAKLDSMYKIASQAEYADSVVAIFNRAGMLIPDTAIRDIGKHQRNLAEELLRHREHAKAIEAFREGLYYLRLAGDSTQYYGSLSGIGESYSYIEIADSATIYHKKALRYFNDIKYDSISSLKKLTKQDTLFLMNYSYSHRAYAFLLKEVQVFDKAYEGFKRHLKSIRRIGTKSDIAGAYLNGGNFLGHTEYQDSAEVYYLTAEKFALELEAETMLAYIYYNMSSLLQNQKRYDEAIGYAEKGVKILAPTQNINGLLYHLCIKTIGECNFHQGNYSVAEKNLEVVLDYSGKNKNYENYLIESNQYLALLYAMRPGKIFKDSAFVLSEKLMEFKRKEAQDKYSDRLAQFEIEMETKKARREAEQNKSIAETRYRNMIFLAGLLLLLVGLSGFLFKLYRDKKRTNEELLRLAAMKDKFISLLAHDIRSPLSAILSSVEIVRDYSDKMPAEAKNKMLIDIDKSGKSLLRMLNDLLKWMRASTKTIKIDKHPERLNTLTENPLRVLSSMAETKNIKISSEIEDDIMVESDPSIINTVIRNLLMNAIKFSPRNSEIVVSAERYENKVRLSVADSGIGMSKEAIEAIEKQVVRSTLGTEGEKGTGFGLQMCREFVAGHGSELEIESEEGKGTTVSFELEMVEEGHESL